MTKNKNIVSTITHDRCCIIKDKKFYLHHNDLYKILMVDSDFIDKF